MKCKGETDGDEIASIVRVWDNSEKGEEFNRRYRNESDTIAASNELEKDKDTAYIAPYKKYGEDSEKWPGDDKYMDGIIDYDKYPTKDI